MRNWASVSTTTSVLASMAVRSRWAWDSILTRRLASLTETSQRSGPKDETCTSAKPTARPSARTETPVTDPPRRAGSSRNERILSRVGSVKAVSKIRARLPASSVLRNHWAARRLISSTAPSARQMINPSSASRNPSFHQADRSDVELFPAEPVRRWISVSLMNQQ
jgi:hypothetical protein